MSSMEEGFLAAELGAIWFILLATGWNKEAAGGLKLKIFAIAAGGLLLLTQVNIPLLSGMMVNGSAVGLLAISLYTWIRVVPGGDRLYTAGCAILLGLLMIWIDSLYITSPIFIVLRAGWDIPLLGGVLAALLSLRAANQLVILTAAAWIASVFPLWLPSLPAGEAIGQAGWWDGFAASAVACRLLSVFIGETAVRVSRRFVRRWNKPEGDI